MSKESMKRWLNARDAYLGGQFPYRIDRPKPRRPVRRKPIHVDSLKTNRCVTEIEMETSSIIDTDRIMDSDESISMITVESQHFTHLDDHSVASLPSEKVSNSPECRDASTQSNTHSETVKMYHPRLFDRLKSWIRSPIHLFNCLPFHHLRTLPESTPASDEQRRPDAIEVHHDHFDDKCIETDNQLSETRISQLIEQHDQSIQVESACLSNKLQHKHDSSITDDEIRQAQNQRIRSSRCDIKYDDKSTATDFVLNFANVEKEKSRDEKENDDKATCPKEEKEQDFNISQSNIEQRASMFLSDSRPLHSAPTPMIVSPHLSNRISPGNDHGSHSIKTSHGNSIDHDLSRSTIISPTESDLSLQEQLQR